jgi:hypothetical protein
LEDISVNQQSLGDLRICLDLPPARSSSLARRLSAGVAGAEFLAALGPIGAALVSGRVAAQAVISDVDILNFALNLEYIEAEFYLRAATGQGLGASDIGGTGTAGAVIGGNAVPFVTPLFARYAHHIAVDEQQHVRFLRSALGQAAVARPLIDLAGGFQAAGIAAGIASTAAPFDPFASETNFFLGAFVFEDVGVTAYAGAAALLQNKVYLSAAASILAVKAYHGGLIRTVLGQLGFSAAFDPPALADLRAQAKPSDDRSVTYPHSRFLDIASTGSNDVAFNRTTTTQVVNIVAPGGQGKGGFLPNGFNGDITGKLVN